MKTERTPLSVRATLAVAGASLLLAAPLRAEDARRLNFVSCPIVRDTASVPCWLTKYQGELYYLGIQTDVSAEFRPPYLGHRVLVEATVSDEPAICGGTVLKPLRISVMPELDASCNEQLPAEDRYVIDFNPRPPGPSGGRLAFQAPPGSGDATPAEPPGPEFLITFDFDRSIEFRHPQELMAVIDYARQVSASEVRVHGNRGSVLLSNGEILTEAETAGRRRAEDIARLLRGVDLPATVTATWSNEPADADGIDDWQSRSVRIVVER